MGKINCNSRIEGEKNIRSSIHDPHLSEKKFREEEKDVNGSRLDLRVLKNAKKQQRSLQYKARLCNRISPSQRTGKQNPGELSFDSVPNHRTFTGKEDIISIIKIRRQRRRQQQQQQQQHQPQQQQ